MTAPTPCTEWDVRTLINHLVGFSRITAASVTGGEMPDWGAQLVGDDPKPDFTDAARDAAAALQGPAVMERTLKMPWGEMTGARLAEVLFMDLTIHSWDLAKATNQIDELDPDLCETALSLGQTMMTDEFRKPGRGFGPEVTVPADAPVCDRLAAFYGRQP
jgi:uncharacterized protein (TIGR03086 family)